MIVVDNVRGVREQVQTYRRLGRTLTFVPTMGNLHRGHVALVRKAKEYGGPVAVSLFINPLQFGENEDLSTYPRTLERDRSVLEKEGIDLLFLPDEQTMYPYGLAHQTIVEVPRLGDILEGVTRPHFFKGVTTVVSRLFNIVQADIAFFGKKDYQQWIIIRRMVEDLAVPVEIVAVDTVREEDGLALSSRNSYLTTAERRIAPLLYKALQTAADRLRTGQRDYARVEQDTVAELTNGGMEPDYISIRHRGNLGVPDQDESEWVILGAAYLGKTRLIDNVEVIAG